MDASHVDPDFSHNDHRNTDSMVTVPLSDVQSNSDPSHPDWRSIPQTPVNNAPETDIEGVTDIAPHYALESELDPNQDQAVPSIRSPLDEVDQEDVENDVVDWAELEKTEEQEPRSEQSDESTALLLARLEEENNALATNPKSGLSKYPHSHKSRPSRSQSLHQIKRLINEPSRPSLRYSQIAPPPMTELEFWAALVADYHQTAQRLPTLTTNKIRGGVPPPLRGVVWPSLAGARDPSLLTEYERLCGETSPYEGLIGKDIGRSFPNVEMFREPHGEGQQMLARVLKCFSLYDTKIGYCQGLGFLVGPLLMHMTDAEAFCVLVRLMDHYNLRTCYLPDLSGLHLRVYQFQNLLARHRPALFEHLESLHVEPAYVSQWFLSFFAVACPLPMLLRIYDVLFLEGASETLMRVGLSLMQRNEKRIMACTEFEDVMQLILSRSIWDTYVAKPVKVPKLMEHSYACHADDLVNDFVSLTSLVTKENLQALEASYSQSQGVPTGISFPQMQASASRFLGRLWTTGSNSYNTKSLNPNTAHTSMTNSNGIRRSASKQSMASTLNSVESTSDASTAPTELSSDPQKPRTKSTMSQNRDRDLHTQIEDLLMALSDLQRQQADLSRELQQEREEREEDHQVAKEMLKHIKSAETETDTEPTDLLAKAEERFSSNEPKRSSTQQTKHQLRHDLTRWKEMHEVEASRCLDLSRRIEESEQENSSLKEQLREARGRIQDGYRDKQRLERTVLDLRSIKTPTSSEPSPTDPTNTLQSPTSDSGTDGGFSKTGLRQLHLVRSNSQKSPAQKQNTPTFNKRTSSLGLQAVLSTENNKPASDEALLLELVNAKTAEAVAKQELEEVKAKLDSLRRMIGVSRSPTTVDNSNNRTSWLARTPSINKTAPEPAKPSQPAASGGFWSGWGRRASPGIEAAAET
ncbi:gtpase activating protein [Aspergillus sclerotialis]|uniref:Gtpase activating protein n=1 Tax=Aspergillus sclerotialis TaxID=2070753 RepID=A0A3A2ZU57_9EURO|nr:gtpase activating protein [Aspergillus sclerotialis]